MIVLGRTLRPIILAVVGDSATGKATLTHGIAEILGPERVAVFYTDDYHRYDRQQRKELGITPLNPACNYLDIMAQHLRLLRGGESILKPCYDHKLGTFGSPEYLAPHPFLIVDGLLGMYSQKMRNTYSVSVYIDPPEELRRRWKIRRDTTQRGYTEQEVLHELTIRERDVATYVRPQRQHADVVVRFYPSESSQHEQDADAHLNVRLTLRGTLHHPDLTEVIEQDQSGCVRSTLGREDGRAVEYLEIDGSISHEPARALEQCMLDQLAASGITTTGDLGQYSDPQVRHSHPLALTQLFLAYHLLRAQQRGKLEM